MPITAEAPAQVVMEVQYTEPGLFKVIPPPVHLKAATLENGTEVKVPLFINTGDKIKIDTSHRCLYRTC
jgi:elongation factor P